jgi:HEPN domain-containing protein
MADAKKVQEHLSLSQRYLEAAELLSKEGLLEPGLFNALHSIELAVKASLYTVIDDDIMTHQVAGLFGKHFRDSVGKDLCKEVAVTLSRYNIPRYPDEDGLEEEDLTVVLSLARTLLDKIVPKIIERSKKSPDEVQ